MTTDPIFENMPLQLEPEQIAALKLIKDSIMYPSTEIIVGETNCNELAIGDLLHKGLIIPVLGGWVLTDAGMREASA